MTPGNDANPTGTQTNYNDAAIQTDVTGLGIELQQNGQPFKLNTPLNVTPANLPKLKAAPVKLPMPR